MSGSALAHSVVEPSAFSKRLAAVIVILYAVVSMVPATRFDSGVGSTTEWAWVRLVISASPG